MKKIWGFNTKEVIFYGIIYTIFLVGIALGIIFWPKIQEKIELLTTDPKTVMTQGNCDINPDAKMGKDDIWR